MKFKKLTALIITVMLAAAITGCAIAEGSEMGTVDVNPTDAQVVVSNGNSDMEVTVVSSTEASDIFTDRDLEQTADLSEAIYIELESGNETVIDTEGIYIISGDVQNSTIIIETNDEAKVQLVLDGVNIINDSSPAVYVKSADKVFITSTGDNYMEVSGNYKPDGDTNLDAVIYSKDDLVLNGTGTLEVISAKGNGITSKDDLKITGGEYVVTSYADGLEANDSIRIGGGLITVTSGKDALHCENDDDSSLGYIYILGGTLDIASVDDAIRANTFVQIDDGDINIATCSEGIEATSVTINGGSIDIYATDDGINATAKVSGEVYIEVNGGTVKIEMSSGDTDGFDSNGYIVINGGTVEVTANSAFDANQTATLNGGTVIVNGEEVTEIVMQMMGGSKRR